MGTQAALGYDVGYFCAGRHFPLLRRPRLHRWSRSGVHVFEVLNSRIIVAGDMGTREPGRELEEPSTEKLFDHVLRRFRPDVVHLQELFGLPSSLIDVAHAAGVPVVMTLQDYLPLCPTLKLFDTDGRICLRLNPGEQCARCCAHAPQDAKYLRRHTTAQYLVRLGQRLPRTRDAAWQAVGVATSRLPRLNKPAGHADDCTPAPAENAYSLPASPAAYQQRRDRNVERLNRVEVLLAMSNRVADIYRELGVSSERLRPLQLTLRHLAGLSPRALERPPARPRFATLGGAASVQKGAGVILDAVRRLEAGGLGGAYTLELHGAVDSRFEDELSGYAAVARRGAYEASGLDELLENVDVGIVPSVWEEAFGYVGVEFLSKGIPVIGNALGGITDYVREGETGWLNADASGTGLATLMANIIREPNQIVELHHRILERRDELIKPMDRHVEELEGIYRQVLDELGPEPIPG